MNYLKAINWKYVFECLFWLIGVIGILWLISWFGSRNEEEAVEISARAYLKQVEIGPYSIKMPTDRVTLGTGGKIENKAVFSPVVERKAKPPGINLGNISVKPDYIMCPKCKQKTSVWTDLKYGHHWKCYNCDFEERVELE